MVYVEMHVDQVGRVLMGLSFVLVFSSHTSALWMLCYALPIVRNPGLREVTPPEATVYAKVIRAAKKT